MKWILQKELAAKLHAPHIHGLRDGDSIEIKLVEQSEFLLRQEGVSLRAQGGSYRQVVLADSSYRRCK